MAQPKLNKSSQSAVVSAERFAVYFYRGDGLIFMAGEMNQADAVATAKANQAQYGRGVAEPGLDHLKNGVLSRRPVMPIQRDGFNLAGIPPGSELSINDLDFYKVDDGRVELEFDRSGSYSVRIYCAPFLPWEGTFENPAS